MKKNKIFLIVKSEAFKYLLFGGLTTLVNFLCFFIYYNLLALNLNLANFLSILISILFAFFTNKFIVFSAKSVVLKDLFLEFLKFISGRILTMLFEIIGVWLLVEIVCFNEYFSKGILQIIVIVSNYFISKFFVFKNI